MLLLGQAILFALTVIFGGAGVFIHSILKMSGWL